MVGKRILMGFMSLFVVLLVVSCTPLIQKPGEVVPKENIVEDKVVEQPVVSAQAVTKEVVVQPNSKPKITIIPPKEKPKPQYDPIVNELIEKTKKIDTYRYTFDASKGGTYDYYINGQKTKKVYLVPIKLNGDINYNEVYLDDGLQDAVVVCTKGVSSCTYAWKKAYAVKYENEKVELTPLSVVANIPYSAQKVGEEVVDNQETSIIEYINGQGKKERLWMDHYTGLPLKQVIYSVDTENGDKELLKHTFTRIILGVKKVDVTFPKEEFELQKE